MSTGELNIRSITQNDRGKDIERFYEIMIHAYKVTEIEIWGENYLRMSFNEFDEVLAKEELVGAWLDEIPVGSIRTYPLSDSTHAFGLFSVDFDYKGRNIGRQLIAHAEEVARKNGAEFMELEILRLKDKDLEVKRQLHNWYVRLGYELVTTIDFEHRKPDKAYKAKNFISASVFDCYRKSLLSK